MRGRTQINLFYEPSTRTQSSFEIAGKRLGADVMNMAVGASSVKKGETLIDTAITLNAMRPDIIVVRHSQAGAVHLLARKVDCSVINAGDGAHEHPTQALLDALTIRRNLGRIEGLTVAICGDILHSRVARSNILALGTLGAHVRVVGPSTLLPAGIENMGVEVFRDMKAGLKDADIVMMLRLQRERMSGAFIPSTKEYFRYFGLDAEKLAYAKPGALVMHPGPMNRGVEIDSLVADGAAVADPRAGRDGRRRAHGGAGSAGEPSAQRVRRLAPRPHHLRRLFRDHDHGRVGVAGDDFGHDGRVDDAQGFEAVDAQARVDDRRLRVGAHRAGSDRMVDGVDAPAQEGADFVVGARSRHRTIRASSARAAKARSSAAASV